jgi:phosphotransferase system  glucose/maltose/N-acetylglucosamine-specific IIC component
MSHVIPGYEKRKVAIDMFKHLATLSIACIAFLASFYSQMKEQPEYQVLLGQSVGAFFICVVCTIITCFILLANLENIVKTTGTFRHRILQLSMLGAVVSFLYGVWMLASLVLGTAP